MEYMHVNVHGGGNKPDALEEFATALVAIADRDGDEIKALGVKPACLRGLIADFAGGVDIEKVEVKDGKVTING